MRKLTIFILILAFLPSLLFSEKKKIYIRRGEGALPIKDTYINTGIVFLSIFEYPVLDPRQIEAILIGLQDRTYSLNSKHTSFGIEIPGELPSTFYRLGFTNSVYSARPYDSYLNALYTNKYILIEPRPVIDGLQNAFLLFSLQYVVPYISTEMRNGVRYETNSIDLGIKYEFKTFNGLDLIGGVDGGIGVCAIRESCTSYNISPFAGIKLNFWDISIALEAYHRYVWLEFGPASLHLNIKSTDTYMITLYREFDSETLDFQGKDPAPKPKYR
ncbi:hypothetical protein EHQ12_16365 [Leptospira gomenensis]|uniref:Uncharacterized protein n=1 Tax=Leptospira gomenensis TaxID=2484974 RepID=A0A5F1Y982_9LEPT|nr:hypothetical protein [Leptospira gomenensis]TGK31838.1 hypothetical protein EHQ17_13560 [Leptospira gomenensis]TGK34810.1 hypothetical protein EHQ12_16365 [Leptospira gomenensis]TGK41701.1 hypothetical protein EHQ07_15915 [Leptospira gomenensis]TGK61506.1 hypothetical protein EHQ13_08950 [Leptospira gomenensis]